jgi:hypothetical protein
MGLMDKDTLRHLFIRVCRDSGFQLDTVRATQLAAAIAKVHPLDVWRAFPSYDTMGEIAEGTHPALNLPIYAPVRVEHHPVGRSSTTKDTREDV